MSKTRAEIIGEVIKTLIQTPLAWLSVIVILVIIAVKYEFIDLVLLDSVLKVIGEFLSNLKEGIVG